MSNIVDGILIDMSIFNFHKGSDGTSYCLTVPPAPELCAPKSKLLPPDRLTEARACIMLGFDVAMLKYVTDWTTKYGNKQVPDATLLAAGKEVFRQFATTLRVWGICDPWSADDIRKLMPGAPDNVVAHIQQVQAGASDACKSYSQMQLLYLILLILAIGLIIYFVFLKPKGSTSSLQYM